MSEKLLPCPFCGGQADFEEVTAMGGTFTYWSVGCQSSESDCIGYQMLAHYNRKCEAAEAWNRRAPTCEDIVLSPADIPEQLRRAISDIDISAYNAAKFRINTVLAALTHSSGIRT